MLTSAEIAYLDSSALVKLVAPEKETPALRTFLEERTAPTSAAVVRVEVMRASRRRGPEQAAAARELLDSLNLVTLTDDLLDHAGRLDPPLLRSLDAIHIAAALDIGAGAVVFVTYDDRQVEAARCAGLTVVSPAEPPPEDAV